MLALAQRAPAVHVGTKKSRRKSRDIFLRQAMLAARGVQQVLPVYHDGRPIASVYGCNNGIVYVGLPLEFGEKPRFGFDCAIYGYAQLQDAIRSGKDWNAFFYYNEGAGGGLHTWVDMWGVGPAAGTFAGTAATARQFSDATPGGLNIGGNVSPAQRMIIGATVVSVNAVSPGAVWLLVDRVLGYDGCSFTTTTQTMTNTLTAQRLYNATGQGGLNLMVELNTATGIVASNWASIIYKDQNGVTQNVPFTTDTQTIPISRTGPTTSIPAELLSGALLSASQNQYGPFITFPAATSGISSVTSYNMSAINTGTLGFVLVRPFGFSNPAPGAVAQYDYLKTISIGAAIADGTCLSWLSYLPNNTNPFFGWVDVAFA